MLDMRETARKKRREGSEICSKYVMFPLFTSPVTHMFRQTRKISSSPMMS